MQEEKIRKKVSETFPDYIGEGMIVEAEIVNANLYKKLSKFEINLYSTQPIKISEIEKFEDFLVTKFSLSEAVTNIDYGDTVISQDLKQNWNDIIKYVSEKERTSRAMLMGSSLDINGKEITVNLRIKGADFLHSKNIEELLERVFKNLCNKKYIVKFADKLEEGYDERLKHTMQQAEKKELQKMQEQAEIETELAKERIRQKKEEEERKKAEEVAARMAELPDIKEAAPEGKSPLIYGRNVSIDGKPIKIVDIDKNSDKVCVDGELVRRYNVKRNKKWQDISKILCV